MTAHGTALVTGGSDGIGKATARRLLADAWAVDIVGRSAARCATAVGELQQPGPARISAVADLTTERGFGGMKVRGRWQWAVHVWPREWNAGAPSRWTSPCRAS